MLILAELTPLDTSTGNRVTLRAASSDDRKITGLNGVRWWPAIKETPVLTIKLFDGDFSSETDVGTAALTLLTDKLARLDANARRYLWAGAGVTIYAGNSGDAWPWTSWFTGTVDSFKADANRLQITAKVSIEPFQKPALTLTYAGTGGIEGGADLKGKPKPWLFGHALNVEPVLIDSINSVFQFSAYGPIQAINNLYERASDFGASVGDFATYTALVAATIPAGRWGTCLASGLIRLGAPQFGVITGDVDGDKPSTWLRKTGEIINRIATNAGVSGTLIDSASLTALDTALPYNINLYLTDQTTVLDLVRRLARPCNAQAAISWLGKLFVTRVAIGSAALTLDSQGRRKPGVIAASESDVSPPYWRLEMGAQRSWRVHTFDEIASADKLTLRGAYSASSWYKPGDIVTDQGTSWQYNGTATPGTGNAPPTLPTVSNTQWTAMSDPGSSIIVTPTASDFRTADNVFSPSSQTISFTAALYNLTGTVSWTAKNPAGTTVKSGTGTSFSLAQSDMGTNLSLIVTATCGWASSQPLTIGVVDDSSASPGATKGRNRVGNPSGDEGITTPWFVDPTGTVGSGLTAFAAVAGPPPSLQLTKSLTTNGGNINLPALKVTPGQVFLFRAEVKGNTATGSGFYINIAQKAAAPTGNSGNNVTTAEADTFYPLVTDAPLTTAFTKTGDFQYTVPAGVNYISLRINSYINAATVVNVRAIEFYELTDYELKADITRILTPAPSQVIQYDYTGTTSSQVPKILTNKLVAGGTDVTPSTSFSYSASGCSVDTTGCLTGQVRLTAVTASNATITVTATYAGVARTEIIPIQRVLGDAPTSGGGGSGSTGFSVDVSASITDTAYDGSPQPLAAPAQMRSNGSGQIRLTLNGEYQANPNQTAQITAKAQKSTDNATWSDAGLSATGTSSAGAYWVDTNGNGQLDDTDTFVDATVGSITANSLVSGFTASTDYWIRWIAFKSGTTTSVGVSGTASGAQS